MSSVSAKKPFAVEQVTNTQGVIPSYGLSAEYDARGKVSSIYEYGSWKEATFTYGPDGGRWKTVEQMHGEHDVERYFLGDMEITMSGPGMTRCNWNLGHGVMLFRDADNPAFSSVTPLYAFTDNQGSYIDFFRSNGTRVFEVNLIQRDEDTGEIIGGETFQIIQEPRPALLPEISYSYEGGHYIMEASNISEEVNYQWYDEGNNLVGTQKQLSVSANRSGDNYRLRVQSKKDGAVNYANVQLNKMSVIKSVAPSPFVDYFTVSLSNPASAGMHLKVTSVATPQVMDEVNILEGETEITLYTSQYLKGAYIVSLCRGNSVIESKTIIK